MTLSFKDTPLWGRLQRKAVGYLSRYPSSEKRFRRTMSRALEKYTNGEEVEALDSAAVLDALVEYVSVLGYLNDEALAKGLCNSYRRRGYSSRMMRQKLNQKGICGSMIEMVLTGHAVSDELAAAVTYARKKKLGVFGDNSDYQSLQRDLQRMARRGFSYSTARLALSNESACS